MSLEIFFDDFDEFIEDLDSGLVYTSCDEAIALYIDTVLDVLKPSHEETQEKYKVLLEKISDDVLKDSLVEKFQERLKNSADSFEKIIKEKYSSYLDLDIYKEIKDTPVEKIMHEEYFFDTLSGIKKALKDGLFYNYKDEIVNGIYKTLGDITDVAELVTLLDDITDKPLLSDIFTRYLEHVNYDITPVELKKIFKKIYDDTKIPDIIKHYAEQKLLNKTLLETSVFLTSNYYSYGHHVYHGLVDIYAESLINLDPEKLLENLRPLPANDLHENNFVSNIVTYYLKNTKTNLTPDQLNSFIDIIHPACIKETIESHIANHSTSLALDQFKELLEKVADNNYVRNHLLNLYVQHRGDDITLEQLLEIESCNFETILVYTKNNPLQVDPDIIIAAIDKDIPQSRISKCQNAIADYLRDNAEILTPEQFAEISNKFLTRKYNDLTSYYLEKRYADINISQLEDIIQHEKSSFINQDFYPSDEEIIENYTKNKFKDATLTELSEFLEGSTNDDLKRAISLFYVQNILLVANNLEQLVSYLEQTSNEILTTEIANHNLGKILLVIDPDKLSEPLSKCSKTKQTDYLRTYIEERAKDVSPQQLQILAAEAYKPSIISIYLRSPANKNISIEDLKDLIKYSFYINDLGKILYDYVENNPEITKENLRKLLDITPKGLIDQSKIICHHAKQNIITTSLEQLIETLGKLNSEEKYKLVKSYVTNKWQEIDIKDFEILIGKLEPTTQEKNKNIVTFYLHNKFSHVKSTNLLKDALESTQNPTLQSLIFDYCKDKITGPIDNDTFLSIVRSITNTNLQQRMVSYYLSERYDEINEEKIGELSKYLLHYMQPIRDFFEKRSKNVAAINLREILDNNDLNSQNIDAIIRSYVRNHHCELEEFEKILRYMPRAYHDIINIYADKNFKDASVEEINKALTKTSNEDIKSSLANAKIYEHSPLTPQQLKGFLTNLESQDHQHRLIHKYVQFCSSNIAPEQLAMIFENISPNASIIGSYVQKIESVLKADQLIDLLKIVPRSYFKNSPNDLLQKAIQSYIQNQSSKISLEEFNILSEYICHNANQKYELAKKYIKRKIDPTNNIRNYEKLEEELEKIPDENSSKEALSNALVSLCNTEIFTDFNLAQLSKVLPMIQDHRKQNSICKSFAEKHYSHIKDYEELKDELAKISDPLISSALITLHSRRVEFYADIDLENLTNIILKRSKDEDILYVIIDPYVHRNIENINEHQLINLGEFLNAKNYKNIRQIYIENKINSLTTPEELEIIIKNTKSSKLKNELFLYGLEIISAQIDTDRFLSILKEIHKFDESALVEKYISDRSQDVNIAKMSDLLEHVVRQEKYQLIKILITHRIDTITFDQFENLVDYFNSHQNRASETIRQEITEYYISNAKFDIENLPTILRTIQNDPYYRPESFITGLANLYITNNYSNISDFEELKNIFQKIDENHSYLSEEILRLHMLNADGTYNSTKLSPEQFEEALKYIDNPITKNDFATQYINANLSNLTVEQLIILIQYTPLPDNQISLYIEQSDITLRQVSTLLESVVHPEIKNIILRNYIRDKTNKINDLEDLSILLQLAPDVNAKYTLSKLYVEKIPELINNDTFEELQKTLETIPDNNIKEIVSSIIVENYLKINLSNLDSIKLSSLLPHIHHSYDKVEICRNFAEKNFSDTDTYELLERKLREIPDKTLKNSIIAHFLNNISESQQKIFHENLKIEELTILLSHINYVDLRKLILNQYLKHNPQIEIEDFQSLLNNIEHVASRIFLLEKYIQYHPQTEIEVFKSLLKNFDNNIAYNQQQDILHILSYYIQSNSHGTEANLNLFIEVAKQNTILATFDVVEVCGHYNRCKLPLSEVSFLCKELYPSNERMQLELFLEFAYMPFNVSRYDIGKDQIKEFCTGLSDEDLVLELVYKLKNRLTNLEIMEMSGNRISNKYESLKESLSNVDITDSITEGGETVLQAEFGSNFDPSQFTFLQIFSYYDINDDLAALKSIIKPETLLKISQNYQPSDKSIYVTSSEKKKTQALLDDDKHKEFKLDLPPTSTLSSYLATKSGISPDAFSIKDSFKFDSIEAPKWRKNNKDGLEIDIFALIAEDRLAKDGKIYDTVEEREQEIKKVSQEVREELTASYKELLDPQTSTPLKIKNFFKTILRTETLNETEVQNLSALFRQRKNDLTNLFQQKGGLGEFIKVSWQLANNCAVNISAQTNIALYKCSIQDPSDQILFAVFQEDILNKISHSNSDIFLSDHDSNIFTNRYVLDTSLSPIALVKAIEEQFVKTRNGKLNTFRNPYLFLKDHLGFTYDQSLDTINNPESSEHPDIVTARLVASLILKEKLPHIYNSKYLAQYRKETEDLLSGILKRSETEEMELMESEDYNRDLGRKEEEAEVQEMSNQDHDAPSPVIKTTFTSRFVDRLRVITQNPEEPNPTGIVARLRAATSTSQEERRQGFSSRL